MAPNATLAAILKGTYGDASHRDAYARDQYFTTSTGTTTKGYYYSTDGTSANTTATASEVLSYNTGTAEAMLHIYTKPVGSSLSTASTSNAALSLSQAASNPLRRPRHHILQQRRPHQC